MYDAVLHSVQIEFAIVKRSGTPPVMQLLRIDFLLPSIFDLSELHLLTDQRTIFQLSDLLSACIMFFALVTILKSKPMFL